MVIVEREGKYFLQISNGELELSEKQAKARLEKGALLKAGSQATAFAGHDDPEQDPEPVLPHTSYPYPAEQYSSVEVNDISQATQIDTSPIAEEEKVIQEEQGPQPVAQNEPTQPTVPNAPAQDDLPTVTNSGTTVGRIWEQDVPTKTGHRAEPKPVKRAAAIVSKIPAEAQAFILSDEYYDNIIREFEKVYVANGRKEKTALELLDHCQRSIDHLKLERSQPGADLALLDYQRICWLRIVVFLQALTGVPAPKHPDSIAAEKEKANSEKELVKQLLVIQLLQETGAFPYADALKSITHDSIVGLVSRILNKDKSIIKTAMQRSGDILLRRNVSPTNAPKRLKMLIEIETYFSELPYNHVIIRLRSLKEFYKNFHDKIS
jgi:hypothetical protein